MMGVMKFLFESYGEDLQSQIEKHIRFVSSSSSFFSFLSEHE